MTTTTLDLDAIKADGGARDVPALIAEVERLREQVGVVRRVGEAEAARAAYEARDAERRDWESRRAVENITLAELKSELDRTHTRAEQLHDRVVELTALLNDSARLAEHMRRLAEYDAICDEDADPAALEGGEGQC